MNKKYSYFTGGEQVIASEEVVELQQVARQIRRYILKMITAAGSGHPGGSLSIAEILACLYWKVLAVDPLNPKDPGRDRLVLSKGHAAPALYAALALRGFFPEDRLLTLRKLGSILQGHPDMNRVPGVEISTGSLGQGLSVANGMALSSRMDRMPWRVYVILGDGELQEGQVWEASMTSSHYRLDNLTAIVDSNGYQIDGPLKEVMSVEPLKEKWSSFGWNTLEADGHSIPGLMESLEKAKNEKGRPTVIIARTVKGKGVSFMEGKAEWHGKAPTPDELTQALKELEFEKEQGT